MALTPQNQDAFLREVGENLRHDRMMDLLRRWGRVAAFVVGAGLILLALFLWWRAHETALAAQDSIALTPALNDIAEGRAPIDAAGLAQVAQSKREGFRAAARLTAAAGAVEKGDLKGAAQQYAAIAGDSGLPQPVRDLAIVRGVAVQFDTLPPAQVIDRLKGLAIVGNPWFGSAGEMTALAWLKQGRKDRAGQMFAAIARDEAVPTTLRGRAAGLATALGQTVQSTTVQTNPKG